MLEVRTAAFLTSSLASQRASPGIFGPLALPWKLVLGEPPALRRLGSPGVPQPHPRLQAPPSCPGKSRCLAFEGGAPAPKASQPQLQRPEISPGRGCGCGARTQLPSASSLCSGESQLFLPEPEPCCSGVSEHLLCARSHDLSRPQHLALRSGTSFSVSCLLDHLTLLLLGLWGWAEWPHSRHLQGVSGSPEPPLSSCHV